MLSKRGASQFTRKPITLNSHEFIAHMDDIAATSNAIVQQQQQQSTYTMSSYMSTMQRSRQSIFNTTYIYMRYVYS